MSELIPRLRDLLGEAGEAGVGGVGGVVEAEEKADALAPPAADRGGPMRTAAFFVAPGRAPRVNGSSRGSTGRWSVTSDFVPLFVGVHAGRSAIPSHSGMLPVDGSAWRAAQAHWEIVVARVLDTDVVAPTLSGDAAIRLAVRASALLLEKMARQGRCPICPDPASRHRAMMPR